MSPVVSQLNGKYQYKLGRHNVVHTGYCLVANDGEALQPTQCAKFIWERGGNAGEGE